MQDLETLGGSQSAAYDVTPDSAVIVGKSLTSGSTASETAFRSTSKRQMENLRRALRDAGVSGVQGWILTSVKSVSADDSVIVRYGQHPTRQFEAFRAVLPVPR
jgi:uncharacterized membrane protein